MIRRALALCLLAGTAQAQDFTIDPAAIDACRAQFSDTPMVCAGQEAEACVDRYGGGPNMVVSACQALELAYWDDALNARYATLQDLAQAEETGEFQFEPEQLSKGVRDIQRTWISYRDARCGHALARAKPFGSAAGPAINGCLLRETARQVFELERLSREYRG